MRTPGLESKLLILDLYIVPILYDRLELFWEMFIFNIIVDNCQPKSMQQLTFNH